MPMYWVSKGSTVYLHALKNISAIRSIIDADMARQQRVHGIFKDFLCYSKSIFVFRSSVNSIGTEGTVYKNRTFYNSIIN